MPVYIQDSLVLVDSDQVATSEDCCCGGVCCKCDGNCDDTITQQDCEDNGGTWFPSNTCDDFPCDTLTTGACCVGTDCSIKTEDCCNNDGGVYQGDGTGCDPNPCGVGGACCIGTVCSILSRDACAAGGGNYFGDGTVCSPGICLQGSGCCFTGFNGLHTYNTATIYINWSYDFTDGDCSANTSGQMWNTTVCPLVECFCDGSGTLSRSGVEPCSNCDLIYSGTGVCGGNFLGINSQTGHSECHMNTDISCLDLACPLTQSSHSVISDSEDMFIYDPSPCTGTLTVIRVLGDQC